ETMEVAMITGMHAVVYTRNAEADRAFFRDVLGFSSVDAGGGWLIFAAPPSELACHPAESNGKHEFYLLCDDLRAEIARLGEKGDGGRPGHGPGVGPPTHCPPPGGGRSRALRATSPNSLSAELIAAEKTAEWRGCGEVMRLRSTITGASCTQVAPAASASGFTTKSGKETPSLKPVMRRPITIFERAANIDPRQIQAMTPPWVLTSCTNLVTQGSSASKAGLLAPPGIRIPTESSARHLLSRAQHPTGQFA